MKYANALFLRVSKNGHELLPNFGSSKLSRNEFVIRNFHKHLREEVRQRKFEILYIGGYSEVRIEWSDEALFYDVRRKRFVYSGEAPGVDVGGDITEFDLTEDLLKLLNSRLKEAMKEVALNKKSQMLCFRDSKGK